MSLQQLITRLLAIEESHRMLVENCDIEFVFIQEKDGQEAVAVIARNGEEHTMEELAALIETRKKSVFVPVAAPHDYDDESLAQTYSDDVRAAWMNDGTPEDLRREGLLRAELQERADFEGVPVEEIRARWEVERPDDAAELDRVEAMGRKQAEAQRRCKEKEEAQAPFFREMYRRLWGKYPD
ncbi:MAG: hypothetical protein ABJF88_06710 [Rhodothermales bacterium]